MKIIGEILGALWSVWKEMFGAFMKYAPVGIKFVLWVLSAIVILPCVYVAGVLYPQWQKWGEGF